MERVDIGGAISYGWRQMVDNVFYWVGVLILFGLIEAAFSAPSGFLYKYPYITIILGIVGMLVGFFVNLSVIHISLRIYRGEKPDFKDMYAAYPKYGKFLIGSILYGLLTLVGFILFIIPGIYFAIKYHFYGYLIVEQDMDPIDALKRSGEITKGVKWHLLLLFIVFWGIMLLGFLACCVGTLFATPILFMALVFTYKRLLDTVDSVVTPAEAGPPEDSPVAPA